MNVDFSKEFVKTLEKITDFRIRDRICIAIEKLEQVGRLSEVKEVSKLKGEGNFYRYKLHDYRIGLLKLSADSIILMRVGHRRDFYDKFPK